VSKSRYSNYWYGIVLKMIKQYPEIKSDTSLQAYIFVRAIEKALQETKQLPDGELRVKSMEMIYFTEAVTIDGAAQRVNVSRGTMLRWSQSFVRMVARNAGYA